ncbi:hypothetical protein [Bacillus sp. UNC41MFS5]|uniref:hypothetical protein n=1 Tax=Bacillus sp. UNC41MFS5 TaxID=1449046 RepID=UPI00047A632F|nr:hypothetical protein [Bacillus sp. UNC41MFS5]
MKKLITVLCGIIIGLSLFVSTGNTAKAAETDECGCIVSPVLGAEKNKIVATLLSSQEFKNVKHSLKSDGYSYNGVKKIEVFINHSHDDIVMVGVPFYNTKGTLEMAVFFNGIYMDPDLIENDYN